MTGRQKMSQEIGLPSLDVEFEKNMWSFPLTLIKGHDRGSCDCGWCIWIREMAGHPGWVTTDAVMACWFAREGLRLYWNTGFYEEIEPEEEGIFTYE